MVYSMAISQLHWLWCQISKWLWTANWERFTNSHNLCSPSSLPNTVKLKGPSPSNNKRCNISLKFNSQKRTGLTALHPKFIEQTKIYVNLAFFCNVGRLVFCLQRLKPQILSPRPMEVMNVSATTNSWMLMTGGKQSGSTLWYLLSAYLRDINDGLIKLSLNSQ
jgi:hypothetical protein